MTHLVVASFHFYNRQGLDGWRILTLFFQDNHYQIYKMKLYLF